MSETVTVTLKKPIEHNGTTYSELTFREAEVGDMMAADIITGEASKTFAILASVSGVPLPVFKKIKISDVNQILSATSELLGNGQASPPTGEA